MDTTFDTPNILNAHIRAAQDSTTLYVVSSTGSPRKPEHTRLEPRARANTFGGTIDWRAHTIAITGHTTPIARLKRRCGLLSRTRAWRWVGGATEYNVCIKNGEWTATIAGSLAPVGRLVPAKRRIFGTDVPARLHVAQTEDEVFLILVLIYSEVRRLQRQALNPPKEDVHSEFEVEVLEYGS